MDFIKIGFSFKIEGIKEDIFSPIIFSLSVFNNSLK